MNGVVLGRGAFGHFQAKYGLW